MAQKVNLLMDQGSDFETTFELYDDFGEPLDLTNYTARGQLRKHYSSNTAYSFTCELAEGVLKITLSSGQTTVISPQRYVYDVEIVDVTANSVIRVVEGFVTVTPEVTK